MTPLDVLIFGSKLKTSATTSEERDAIKRFVKRNLVLPVVIKSVEVAFPLGGQLTVMAELDRPAAKTALDALVEVWERRDMATQAEASRASGIPLTRINQAIKDGRLPYYVVPSANPRRGRRVVSMAEVHALWRKEE